MGVLDALRSSLRLTDISQQSEFLFDCNWLSTSEKTHEHKPAHIKHEKAIPQMKPEYETIRHEKDVPTTKPEKTTEKKHLKEEKHKGVPPVKEVPRHHNLTSGVQSKAVVQSMLSLRSMKGDCDEFLKDNAGDSNPMLGYTYSLVVQSARHFSYVPVMTELRVNGSVMLPTFLMNAHTDKTRHTSLCGYVHATTSTIDSTSTKAILVYEYEFCFSCMLHVCDTHIPTPSVKTTTAETIQA
ncbi:hypothetical protein Anapl_08669 [Anas platyrhynchos]|uniref:Uncharacterized protein n=1 Tax=Anas platyrhynchos TaxID=8839 RepID=R0LR96_ANAPL|nr:hypothetical protein Anapl_08669 [Anas platyrhynchos]